MGVVHFVISLLSRFRSLSHSFKYLLLQSPNQILVIASIFHLHFIIILPATQSFHITVFLPGYICYIKRTAVGLLYTWLSRLWTVQVVPARIKQLYYHIIIAVSSPPTNPILINKHFSCILLNIYNCSFLHALILQS